MKKILYLALISAFTISSCTTSTVIDEEYIPPTIISDSLHVAINEDTFKVSRSFGFNSDTTTGYEIIWELNNTNNPSLGTKERYLIHLFVYDNAVNPSAMNTFQEVYEITSYDNTSNNFVFSGKCGIKISHYLDDILVNFKTSSAGDGFVYYHYDNPNDVFKFNTNIEGLNISLHQKY